MLRIFRNIRPGEARDTWAGFSSLLFFIASHAILETGRDALFLADIPASRLPWMYIGIGIASLLMTVLQRRVSRLCSDRAALSFSTLAASMVTAGFFFLLPMLGKSGLYALYIWSGVLATLVLIHFWTLMGDLFSVTQAKRLYGVIGAGSVVGAILGAATAKGLATFVDDRYLILAAAVGFALAAVMPYLLSDRGEGAKPASDRSRSLLDECMDDCRYILRSVYSGRVAVLLMVSAAGLTFADYLFKEIAAAQVDPSEYGSFFATVSLILNSASLFVQLVVVGYLLRRFGPPKALAVLPVLLLIGALGLVAVPVLAAALFIKGADGSFRYSVHRTASELLFVPLSDAERRRVKGFIDVIGQRGGQALASIALLGAIALGASLRQLAVLLACIAVLWVMIAFDLRKHYLEIFRGRLRRSRLSSKAFPQLDVSSLESLIAALDSPNDEEVIAAMTILEEEKKGRLVPGLILYHPSEVVVLEALDLFADHGRVSVVGIIDRLLDHPSSKIRAAAVAARSVLAPDAQLLRMRLSEEPSADVRATIMVNLIASGDVVGSDAKDSIDAIVDHGTISSKLALAEAVARRRADRLADALIALAADFDRGVRIAAVDAMAAVGDPVFLSSLSHLLGDEGLRAKVRHVLPAFGREGLDALAAVFEDQATPRPIRWQLPAAIAAFETQEAAERLLGWLPEEDDGMVRYRIVQTLQVLVTEHPGIELDDTTLDEAISKTVTRAYRYIDRGLTLVAGVQEDERRKTPGHDLLAKLLTDKRIHCVDRLFRLLALRYPREDFDAIRRGITSTDQESRISSLELVENLVPTRLRGSILGLIDDVSDESRLSAGHAFHERLGLDYEGLLRHMLDSSSDIVQDLTAFHIGELRLGGVFEERLQEIGEGRPSSDVDRALELRMAA